MYKMTYRKFHGALTALLAGAFILTACSSGGLSLTTPTATPTSEPTPTVVPLKTLVEQVLSGEICDGKTQAAILKTWSLEQNR